MSNKYRKEDFDFKIEEFTEEDLFEVGLDDNQKSKIKKRMSKLLNELKEANDKFNIDITIDDMIRIKNKLGEEECEHGIRNSNVLKYIILKVIDKDMELLKEEVIDELFVPSFISVPGVNTSYINHGAIYFFKLYLTKDKLIYYGISERFKIVKKKVIDIKNIKVIGKSVKNKKWSKGVTWGIDTMTGYMSFIECNNKEIIYLNSLKSKYRKNTINFLTTLENITGIKAVNQVPLTKEDKFALSMQIILIILFIGLVIPRLIKLCIDMHLLR